MGSRNDNAVYDYADNVTLRLYALQDGIQAHTTVYSEDNQPVLTAHITRQGSTYHIHADSPKPCRIALINAGIPITSTHPYQMQDGTPTISLQAGADITVTF